MRCLPLLVLLLAGVLVRSDELPSLSIRDGDKLRAVEFDGNTAANDEAASRAAAQAILDQLGSSVGGGAGDGTSLSSDNIPSITSESLPIEEATAPSPDLEAEPASPPTESDSDFLPASEPASGPSDDPHVTEQPPVLEAEITQPSVTDTVDSSTAGDSDRLNLESSPSTEAPIEAPTDEQSEPANVASNGQEVGITFEVDGADVSSSTDPTGTGEAAVDQLLDHNANNPPASEERNNDVDAATASGSEGAPVDASATVDITPNVAVPTIVDEETEALVQPPDLGNSIEVDVTAGGETSVVISVDGTEAAVHTLSTDKDSPVTQSIVEVAPTASTPAVVTVGEDTLTLPVKKNVPPVPSVDDGFTTADLDATPRRPRRFQVPAEDGNDAVDASTSSLDTSSDSTDSALSDTNSPSTATQVDASPVVQGSGDDAAILRLSQQDVDSDVPTGGDSSAPYEHPQWLKDAPLECARIAPLFFLHTSVLLLFGRVPRAIFRALSSASPRTAAMYKAGGVCVCVALVAALHDTVWFWVYTSLVGGLITLLFKL